VVGDLRLPGGSGPFPVILWVHGDGPADRTDSDSLLPLMELVQQAGYAFFSWDKPGSGESTGTIDDRRLIEQRSQILLDAITVMKARPDIDRRWIGLAGASQAGYVMPRALMLSKDIAFVICVSCPGMAGNDRMAFQVTALALCNEVPEEKADEKADLLADLASAQTYDTYEGYVRYREVLEALAGIASVSLDPWPVTSQETWEKNTPINERTWNPAKVMEQVTVPVLAFFGGKDRQMDPIQAAHVYRQALEQGNPHSRVELYADANHSLVMAETGCPEELCQIAQSGKYTIAPHFIKTLDQWLRQLR
jgi:pimeloyl-ACP methyl ester carboxylesterase